MDDLKHLQLHHKVGKKNTKKSKLLPKGVLFFFFFTHSNRISEYFLHFIFSIENYSFFHVSILWCCKKKINQNYIKKEPKVSEFSQKVLMKKQLRYWTLQSIHCQIRFFLKIFLGKSLINIAKTKLDFRKILKIFIEKWKNIYLFLLLKTFDKVGVENFDKVSSE
jgi:hypothetical protein